MVQLLGGLNVVDGIQRLSDGTSNSFIPSRARLARWV